MSGAVEHRFGGPWTEVKLDAVEYYLDCYSKALGSRFDLWYFDAFAGTGERSEETIAGGILEGGPLRRRIETLDVCADLFFLLHKAQVMVWDSTMI
jgi:hypothetical protein